MVKKLTIFTFFAVVIFCLYVAYDFVESTSTSIATPKGTSQKESLVKKVTHIFDKKSPLGQILESKINDLEGTYGIYVKNLRTGETIEINSSTQFQTASLYKLWIMAETQNQIKNGKITKSTVVSLAQDQLDNTLQGNETKEEDKPDSNQSGAENAQVSMTVASAMEQMIIISDNYSALLLANRLGDKNVIDFLKTHAFNESTYTSPPTSTPQDTAKFYELLYRGQIVARAEDDEMLNLLKRQRLNDRLPKYLPENIDVAHKTGELDTYKHDAGIVFAKSDYIVVIMTNTENPQVAAENTAKLSQTIYEYFSKQ